MLTMRLLPLTLPISLIAIVLTGAAAPAEAGVRNYFTPRLDGARVDACLSSGPCGKPAADAFCKKEGYDKAMIFQRESYSTTRLVDSGQACEGGNCTAFKQVKCFSTKDNLAGL
jgi:hypothetical protein